MLFDAGSGRFKHGCVNGFCLYFEIQLVYYMKPFS